VAWVAERKDVLSTFFGLLCLLAYHAYARDRRLLRYAAVVVAFALSLMAKPMLVTLPFLLLLLDHWPLRRTAETPLARLLLEKAPLMALSAAASALTLWAQQQAGAIKSLETLPLARRAANALVAYVSYVLQTLWPTGLAVLYPYPASIPAWKPAAASLLLALITLAVAREARRQPSLLTGWLWYLGLLVPVIGLVQVGSQAMADRYMYLPMVGLLVMLAWGIPERIDGRWLRIAAVSSVAACAVLAHAQLRHWSDSVSLWRRALAVTRDNAWAHNNLGHALLKQARVADAMPELQEAVRLKPDYAEARNNLGHALSEQGRTDEAIAQYREALRLLPGYNEVHNNLGVALLRQGRHDEAIRSLGDALRLQPGIAHVRANLALAHGARARARAEQGRLDEALVDPREALRLVPGDPDDHYDLGVLLYRKGQSAEAVQQFEAALKLDPSHALARQALDAWARAGAR
jgi:tetratricopeptide (TPR) repeat protein